MNINSTVELSFDLTKRKNALTVSAKQRDDKTRSVTVRLTLGGQPFKKPEGAEIKLCGTKPDSTVFELLPTSSAGSNYTFFLTDYVLSAEGRIRCEVKCSYDDGDDVRVCSTETFYIKNEASAMIADHSGVTVELQSVERATAAAYNAAEVAAKTVEELYEARNKGEFNGKTPVKGVDYWTEADKNAIVSETVDVLSDDKIPDYWYGAFSDKYGNTYSHYLDDKINAVKALQDEGGKDCFSFVVMTDMHYPSNLGKRAPALSNRIMDECAIKYALCLGDTQTRGCHATEEALIAENASIGKMLEPLRGRLLRTQGNHDGNYGILSDSTYAYRLPPSKLFGDVYRPVALVGDVHFDESGSAYYIDDTAAKVRYIVLNTHNTAYETNADGSQKYPNQRIFRFGQSQYDFLVNEALSGLSDGWSIVVGGHAPITTGYAENWGGSNGKADGDSKTMRELLTAFNNKTTYSREWAGTADGGSAYKNLADTTDAYWKKDTRINSSLIETTNNAVGQIVSNYFPIESGKTLRVKGMTYNNDFKLVYYTGNPQTTAGATIALMASYSDKGIYTIDDGVLKYTFFDYDSTGAQFGEYGGKYKWCRICGTPSNGAENVIITIDEEISETSRGYDAVTVNADFTNARGEIIGYFAGHMHADYMYNAADYGVNIITTRCDAKEENDSTLNNERVRGTITEQSFDVFTVNKITRTVNVTKIGAGENRSFSY